MRIEFPAIFVMRRCDIIRHGIDTGGRRAVDEKPRMIGRALEDKLRPPEFQPERHHHDLREDALDREGFIIGKGVGGVCIAKLDDMDGPQDLLRIRRIKHRAACDQTIIIAGNEFSVRLHDGDALSLAIRPVYSPDEILHVAAPR